MWPADEGEEIPTTEERPVARLTIGGVARGQDSSPTQRPAGDGDRLDTTVVWCGRSGRYSVNIEYSPVPEPATEKVRPSWRNPRVDVPPARPRRSAGGAET
jgi:hypothetical protein